MDETEGGGGGYTSFSQKRLESMKKWWKEDVDPNSGDRPEKGQAQRFQSSAQERPNNQQGSSEDVEEQVSGFVSSKEAEEIINKGRFNEPVNLDDELGL